MRRVWRIAIGVAGGIAALCGLGLTWLYFALHHTPTFYEQAGAEQPPVQKQKELGDQVERQALELRNAARREGAWRAEFTDEQLNAWLITDLPKKFGSALPNDVTAPRIRFAGPQIEFGCTYTGPRLQTVVWLTAGVSLTDRPNEVAVRIGKVRAGRVPLPPSTIVERITDQARHQRIDLRWSQQDGAPVALIHVPWQHPETDKRRLVLEGIEVGDGKIVLAGRTE